jgi:hypothetical protein
MHTKMMSFWAQAILVRNDVMQGEANNTGMTATQPKK